MKTRRFAILGAGLALLPGCASPAPRDAERGTPQNPSTVSPDLLARIEQSAADLRELSDPVPPPAGADGSAPLVAAGRPAQANISPAIEIDPASPTTSEPEPSPALARDSGGTTPPNAAPSPGVAGAARELARRLREDPGVDPIRVYAALAALDMIEPGIMVNPASIRGLSPEDARVLETWADLMRQADSRLTSSPDDARALAGAILDAAGSARAFEPLGVRTAALCSRVEGFGRYVTMNATWLAGSPHKAIVYAEVDHFGAAPAVDAAGAAGYEVRLTQELQLYHDADGLLAWRMPPQRVNDFSRNQRRDFFIVQMIDLPASLSVGRYRLKVSIRDEITGQSTEAVLPVTIVADAGLVGPPTR